MAAHRPTPREHAAAAAATDEMKEAGVSRELRLHSPAPATASASASASALISHSHQPSTGSDHGSAAPSIGNGVAHRPLSQPRRSPTQLSGDTGASSTRVFAGDCLRDRVALLILDMQEHFRPFAAPILPHLLPLIRLASSGEMADAALVIFTQHGHPARPTPGPGESESRSAPSADDGALGRFWGADHLIRKGAPDWQLLPEIAPLAKRIMHKQRYDAFHDTDLCELLSCAGVSTVVIGGVLTNLCCETTARSAFVRDFDVLFLTDGTGARHSYMHDATLINIEYGFGRLLTCREAMQHIKQLAADRLQTQPATSGQP